MRLIHSLVDVFIFIIIFFSSLVNLPQMFVELLWNCVCQSVFNGENHRARHVWTVFRDALIIEYTRINLLFLL